MKIITVQFDYKNNGYSRLLRSYRNSVNLQMPDVGLSEFTYSFNKETDTYSSSVAALNWNTFKLEKWVEIIENYNENLCFTDCDMLMTNRIDDVGEYDFDIAYTVRQKGKLTGRGIPYNGGVVFVRPNERSLKFFRRGLEVNNQMMENKNFHQQGRKKYAGINQSAFGYLSERESDICNLLELPCPIGNAVDETGPIFDNTVKMVHIKSHLRKCCLSENVPPPNIKYLVDLGKGHETLDERKDELLENIDNVNEDNCNGINRFTPLSIIIPKLNDTGIIEKIKKQIYPEDELFIYKNVKQNYSQLLKKCTHEDVLLINPSNFRLLNYPSLIDGFRNDDIVVYNNDRVEKSSIKTKNYLLKENIESGIISFRYLVRNFMNLKGIEKKHVDKLTKKNYDFDWTRYTTKEKLKRFLTN